MGRWVLRSNGVLRFHLFTLLLGVLAAWAPPEVAAQKKDIGFAAAGPGASAYVMAGGLAELVSRESKLIRLTAQTTKGFVANVRLIEAKETDMGFTAAPLVYDALRAIAPYREKHRSLRGVYPVWSAPFQCVAYAKSGVRKESDLAGKHISLGLSTTSGAQIARLVLGEAGLWGKVRHVYLNFDQSANAMRDGKLDGMCSSAAGPIPAILNAGAGGELIAFPWSQETLRKVIRAHPAFSLMPLPKGTYPWLKEDAPTIGHWSLIIAHKDTPAEAIYEVLRIMTSEKGLAYLLSSNPGWKRFPVKPDLGIFAGLGLPLHPGAERFLKERGFRLPAITPAAP